MRKLWAVVLLFFCGCAYTQQVQDLSLRLSSVEGQLQAQEKRLSRLEARQRDLNRRFSELEKRLSALEKETGALSQRRADLLAEIQKTQAEIARLNGLLEELSYQQRQDQAAFSEFQGEVLKRLAALEKGKKVSAPPSPTGKTSRPGQEELYRQGLAALKQKNYARARKLFRQYLELYPQGKYAPNAYFWIGETYYAQRRYEEAILEYQKVVDHYPKHYKVPAALLKQALSFLHLGDNEAARILFRKIVKEYPRSEQAPVARKYLKRLGR